MHYLNIASRISHAPLMIEQSKLQTIMQVLDPRFRFGPSLESDVSAPRRERKMLNIKNGVAVIPIDGTLVSRASGLQAESGIVTYSDIADTFQAALMHPDVNSIVLDIDSPGGEAAGCFDLADLIFSARGKKPIIAIANSIAASAAYAIASAADEVLVSRLSYVGSIGVITAHIDQSQYDANEGLKYTLVYAGAHKADLNPHAPISPDALGDLQARIDAVYGIFVSTVARNRGMSEEAVRSTEAGVFMGEKAIEFGLADAVSTLPDALSQLSRSNRSLYSFKPIKESLMQDTNDVTQNNPAPTAEPAPAVNPAPAAEPAPTDQPTAAPAPQENEAAVAANAAAIAGMAIKLGVSPEFTESLIKKNLKMEQAKAQIVDYLAANQPAANINSSAPVALAAPDASLPLEERCEAEWKKNPSLRAEFSSLKSYTAYEKANAAGLIKVLTGKEAA